MSRIRSTHPDQWTDENFVKCSPLARLFAIGLRNEADDNGIFEWKPTQLRWKLLPEDSVDPMDLLGELIETKQVMQYSVGGREFGMIRNFQRFQSPYRPSFKHPPPPEDSLSSGYTLHDKYWRSSGGVVESSTTPQQGKGKGKGKGSNTSARSRTDSKPDDAILEFETVGIPNVWYLTESQVKEWRESYGEVCDVDAEIKRARQWLIDNPRRRKTASGMKKFLGGWISRAINSNRAIQKNQPDTPAINWAEVVRDD